MKVSYHWLKQYLNTDLPPEELSEIMTNTGLEVESLETYSPVKGGLEGVVIGEVIHCEKHPQADKLSVTKVNIGNEKIVPIVCGAPNVKAGQKVPVATVGTVLYKGEEQLTIKKAKLRGETSEGMICAEDEIGMGTSHDGIMELNPDAVPGTPAKEYFNIEEDIVFDIDLTPNRIDAASHIGVARDLAAALHQQNQQATLHKPAVDDFVPDEQKIKAEVIIEEPQACPRYAGVCIADVEVKESPKWLQNRLKAIGLNPINNIVDITNYVLHETGQPLHAFDMAKIKGNKIYVKCLPQNTEFITLDEVNRKLTPDDLMICNAEKGMAMAGIFGGMDSGVTRETKDVFIESAYFNPVYIRKTAKRHGLSTDSSFRFERGADPENTLYALKRAALLMKEIGGGTIASEIIDEYPNPIQPQHVQLSVLQLNKFIGQKIPVNTFKQILIDLDFEIINETDEAIELKVPPYRVDVTREADVIEEILRIYGYNNIEAPEKLNANLSFAAPLEAEEIQNNISHLLTSNGFNEIMVNSLTKSAYYDHLSSYPQTQCVPVVNPLSSDLNVLRQTLLFGGLETISHNIKHKNPDLKLYEFGNCYAYIPADGSTSKEPLADYRERLHLGLFLSGDHDIPNWITKQKPSDFFHAKAYSELILGRLGLFDLKYELHEFESDIFSEALQYTYNNKRIAEIGKIKKSILEMFEIESMDVYFSDIHWYNILELLEGKFITYKEVPKYPEVKRDLSLLLNKNIKYQQIKELAFQTEKSILKDITLFDIYESEKIGKDNKSYAVSFTFQKENKTLTDKEVDKIMNKLMNVFEKEMDAKIR